MGGVSEFDRFWFWDESHWPHPTTPLSATLELPAMADGFTRACRALERPFPAYHIHVEDGFVYFGFDILHDAAERAARDERHAAILARRIPDTARFWREDVLPAVRASAERMRDGAWGDLSNGELAEALDGLYEDRAHAWDLHDQVLVPAMAAHTRFLELFRRRFPNADPETAHDLLRGLPNKTVESAAALWRLTRDVESVRYAGLPPEQRAATAMPPALSAYLNAYGWRTDGWELSDPAVWEAPGPVLARLRRYAQAEHPDPEVELARAATRREQATSEALAGIANDAEREEFRRALEHAHAYPVLSEDHNFYIDQMGLTALRVPLLHMGARLAGRGLLGAPDDVFFLTRDELRDALSNSTAPPLTATIGDRRAERERRRGTRPPATIGSLPPELADDPLYAGFFGIGAEPKRDGPIIKGMPGAPGRAAGHARVVRSLAEGDDLEPGEILVCPTTSPAWTPLFVSAAAVVTDAGGMLSHTAIVAREYGIPAVVAARIACRAITTGDWIEVDGTAGEVRWGE